MFDPFERDDAADDAGLDPSTRAVNWLREEIGMSSAVLSSSTRPDLGAAPICLVTESRMLEQALCWAMRRLFASASWASTSSRTNTRVSGIGIRGTCHGTWFSSSMPRRTGSCRSEGNRAPCVSWSVDRSNLLRVLCAIQLGDGVAPWGTATSLCVHTSLNPGLPHVPRSLMEVDVMRH